MYCPKNIIDAAEFGNGDKCVSWPEPSAIDLSGNVTLSLQNHFSGDVFAIGNSMIRYVFTDSSGNSVACEFNVTITTSTGEGSILSLLFNQYNLVVLNDTIYFILYLYLICKYVV